MTAFYLKKGNGWHEVNGVEDVRVTHGEFRADDGTQERGDLMVIIMKFFSFDTGQIALRKLLEMEPRVIDCRIIGESKLDASIILCGDEAEGSRYAIIARVLGIRPAGQSVTVH